MKKINYVLILFAIMAGLMTNCNDEPTGGEVPPVDSTMWDFKLDYPVEIIMSEESYEGVQVEIDFAAIAAELGITKDELLLSMADSIEEPDVTLYAIGGPGTSDVEVGTPSNTNGIWGHWWDASGLLTAWGETAMVFAEYFSGDEFISIGQYPGHLTDGQVIEFYECIKYNDIRVACHFTITAKAPAVYVDPETPPAGDPTNLTLDVTFNQAYNNAYTSVSFDVKETLRNAFKMTTYQIHKAIGDGNLRLYQGAVADTAPGYTADVPGYWLTADGTVTSWGTDSKVWCSLGHSETELFLYAGNHPDVAVTGDIITTKYIATCNGGSATFNITYKVE